MVLVELSIPVSLWADSEPRYSPFCHLTLPVDINASNIPFETSAITIQRTARMLASCLGRRGWLDSNIKSMDLRPAASYQSKMLLAGSEPNSTRRVSPRPSLPRNAVVKGCVCGWAFRRRKGWRRVRAGNAPTRHTAGERGPAPRSGPPPPLHPPTSQAQQSYTSTMSRVPETVCDMPGVSQCPSMYASPVCTTTRGGVGSRGEGERC